MDVEIRPENREDRTAIRHINIAAFGRDVEASLVDALRDDGSVVVSLVAELYGEIVGHILFSPVSIMTTSVAVIALSLAPMAVLPRHQRMGIGSRLVEEGLEVCRNRGDRIVVVLGHPEFYPRFGFSAELAASLESPFGGGKAWMALELATGSLAGIQGRVEYAPPFQMFE